MSVAYAMDNTGQSQEGLFLALLALRSFALCAAAFAYPGAAQVPRKAIQWSTDCAYYAFPGAQDDYHYERTD